MGTLSNYTKSWMKQYFDDNNFPEWTKTNLGITVPLSFPEPGSILCPQIRRPSPCIFCEFSEDLSSDDEKKSYLRHLLEEHDFVIGEVNMIGDLDEYVRYWKLKFESGVSLQNYTTLMKAPTGPDKKEKTYYFLSDVSSEDKELRINLQMKKLESVLKIQENERKGKDFSRNCLFCRSSFEGDPKALFDHMVFNHNFSVGQPDNLVFVTELLDILEKKLENMTCIYCEKVFKNREVLKEHMRKKSHKKINPKNSKYDKYYLVNYLEFGKSWSSSGRRDDFDEDDELPTGFESDDENENDWSDWKGELGGAVCLFCPASYLIISDLTTHMIDIHHFDFETIRKDLSFYQQVKLINFVRRMIHLKQCINCSDKFKTAEDLKTHMELENHFQLPEETSEWDQSQYFFPTYENDHFLYSLDGGEDTGDDPPVFGEDYPVKKSILSEETVLESLKPKNRKPPSEN